MLLDGGDVCMLDFNKYLLRHDIGVVSGRGRTHLFYVDMTLS